MTCYTQFMWLLSTLYISLASKKNWVLERSIFLEHCLNSGFCNRIHMYLCKCVPCLFIYCHEFVQPLMETHCRSRMLARLALSNAQYLLSRFWRSHLINWYLHYHCYWSFVHLLFSSCLISWTVLQVDRIPIPLLFMRTVIQALDAFPALVCWFLFWFIDDEFDLFVFVTKKLDFLFIYSFWDQCIHSIYHYS